MRYLACLAFAAALHLRHGFDAHQRQTIAYDLPDPVAEEKTRAGQFGIFHDQEAAIDPVVADIPRRMEGGGWDKIPLKTANFTDENLKSQGLIVKSREELKLAIADALKKTPPTVGVDLLFVDGEDYGTFTPDIDVLLGSSYFAEHLPNPQYKPMIGVLWDMIGDADLQIYQEINSVNAAPEIVQRVWGKAKELGYESSFIPQAKVPITDDHMPLIKAGLRVVDVIDIDYDYHHKVSDTIDKVSAKSMRIVGDVAMALLRP